MMAINKPGTEFVIKDTHRGLWYEDGKLAHRRQQFGEALAKQPALLRLQELETLRELARNGNARIYIGFDKHWPDGESASR